MTRQIIGHTSCARHTGQSWLPELGMNYYKARMYSPTLGRFMQSDPIGYDDGMNMYNYVDSDPVNKVDPTGLACQVIKHYTAGRRTGEEVVCDGKDIGSQYTDGKYVYQDDGAGNATIVVIARRNSGSFAPSSSTGGLGQAPGGQGGQGGVPSVAKPAAVKKLNSVLDCAGSAFWNNAGDWALNAAGLALEFTPVGQGVKIVGGLALGTAGMVKAAINKDLAAGMNEYVGRQAGAANSVAASGSNMARVSARLGKASLALSIGMDAAETYQDYEACRNAK